MNELRPPPEALTDPKAVEFAGKRGLVHFPRRQGFLVSRGNVET